MKGKPDQREQQLTRKLSAIKDVLELKRIYVNVEEQNGTLRQDILTLKYKVDVLMQKQKTRPHHTRDDQLKTNELEASQKELKFQYRLMQELKKRVESSRADSAT
jgi:hypothetical protein